MQNPSSKHQLLFGYLIGVRLHVEVYALRPEVYERRGFVRVGVTGRGVVLLRRT